MQVIYKQTQKFKNKFLVITPKKSIINAKS